MQSRYSRLSWGLLVIVGILLGMGCGRTISPAVHQQAQPPIPFRELRANPEAFTGRTVILGGEILNTLNTENHTFVEVLQKPLDRSDAPRFTDKTAGRFMARCDSYLDPAIYAKDRQVTIAGRVLGRHTGQVGETEYVYPLMSCIETHLWPRTTAANAPYGYYDAYPWYPHLFYHHLHPFYGLHYPYYRHHRRHRR
ncbi:MAG: Slp family lipoprotein [Candidatus Tectomicrobia bacterium]|nr:Slp family lipoprotein [Candidatus Tectomicrobia bacterium]